jgi:HSP20 family protein
MFGLVPFRRKADDMAVRRDFFDLDNFFEDFWKWPFSTGLIAAPHPIKADIRETDKEYILEADLPGVRKEDISLEMRDGVLTVGVEHNEQIDEKRENYIRKERRYGSFSRSFRVDGVDQEKINAKYNDGVLTVHLPKAEEEKPKTHRIDIN